MTEKRERKRCKSEKSEEPNYDEPIRIDARPEQVAKAIVSTTPQKLRDWRERNKRK